MENLWKPDEAAGVAATSVGLKQERNKIVERLYENKCSTFIFLTKSIFLTFLYQDALFDSKVIQGCKS